MLQIDYVSFSDPILSIFSEYLINIHTISIGPRPYWGPRYDSGPLNPPAVLPIEKKLGNRLVDFGKT